MSQEFNHCYRSSLSWGLFEYPWRRGGFLWCGVGVRHIFLDKRFELFFVYGAVYFFNGSELLFVFVVATDDVVRG